MITFVLCDLVCSRCSNAEKKTDFLVKMMRKLANGDFFNKTPLTTPCCFCGQVTERNGPFYQHRVCLSCQQECYNAWDNGDETMEELAKKFLGTTILAEDLPLVDNSNADMREEMTKLVAIIIKEDESKCHCGTSNCSQYYDSD